MCRSCDIVDGAVCVTGEFVRGAGGRGRPNGCGTWQLSCSPLSCTNISWYGIKDGGVDEDDEVHSRGSYYDVNDPFIDDSELFDVEKSKRIETEMKGLAAVCWVCLFCCCSPAYSVYM